jgi:hypothetical protein
VPTADEFGNKTNIPVNKTFHPYLEDLVKDPLLHGIVNLGFMHDFFRLNLKNFGSLLRSRPKD